MMVLPSLEQLRSKKTPDGIEPTPANLIKYSSLKGISFKSASVPGITSVRGIITDGMIEITHPEKFAQSYTSLTQVGKVMSKHSKIVNNTPTYIMMGAKEGWVSLQALSQAMRVSQQP